MLAMSMDPELVSLIKRLYLTAQATGHKQEEPIGVSIVSVDKHGVIGVETHDSEEWRKFAGQFADYVVPQTSFQENTSDYPTKRDAQLTVFSSIVSGIMFPVVILLIATSPQANQLSGALLIPFVVLAIAILVGQVPLYHYCDAMGSNYWSRSMANAKFAGPKNLKANADALGVNPNLFMWGLYSLMVVDFAAMAGLFIAKR